MNGSVFVTPGMSPAEIVGSIRNLQAISFTSTGMRDAGQSDYKNRLRMCDLATLSGYYNDMGLFSAECHGGARWHVGVMNRRESPFEELALLREKMPNVLLQTLVRETSLWGYRPYPKNVIERVVSQVDIDVWRCFSFLNDVRNMRLVAEVVMQRGRLFQPAIAFTRSDWATNDYYLNLVREIVSLCGGTDEIILCVKDMAGVGSPQRIHSLIDAIKQAWPELVVQYHRHATDGLALPALLAAARAGAAILDVEEDSLTRFYGQAPMLAVAAFLEESGLKVHLQHQSAEGAVQKVREWIRHYDWAESPFKGFDYGVLQHRMPGGAFPSSFEQAQKGGFLHLMPAVLTMMSLYNRIIRYFDVTPGSQITWVTCSGIINHYARERGMAGVDHIIALLTRFVDEKDQDIEALTAEERDELLQLFRGAPGDFRSLLSGSYGRLPAGWPADWVYRSTFGDEASEKIARRRTDSPLDALQDEDLTRLHEELVAQLGREPAEEEFILYLMHPKDALELIRFRAKYGDASRLLPSDVWRSGLAKAGDSVEFEYRGVPYSIERVSIGAEHDGLIHAVMKVNNQIRVFTIETPRARKTEIRMAQSPLDVGAPLNATLWRVGNTDRGVIRVGDIVHKGEEIANLEAMKMENAILAPFDARISEIPTGINRMVIKGQLLFVLEAIPEQPELPEELMAEGLVD